MSIPFYSKADPPSLEIVNGITLLKVPQLGIEIKLPPSNSEIYKMDSKTCNSFNVFRKLCFKALKGHVAKMNSSDVSVEAGQCWQMASDSFKEYFTIYSDEINVKKPKKHRFSKPYNATPRHRRTRAPNKNKKTEKTLNRSKEETRQGNDAGDHFLPDNDFAAELRFVLQEKIVSEYFQTELQNFACVEPVQYDNFWFPSYSHCYISDAMNAERNSNFNRLEKLYEYTMGNQ